MHLNLPIAEFHCQLIADFDFANDDFLNRYKSLNKYRKVSWKIILKKNKVKENSKFRINLYKKTARIVLPGNKLIFKDIRKMLEAVTASLALNKKLLFFHASSFVKNGYAYVFAGERGAGKSTIVKLARNLKTLTDDVCIVGGINNQLFIYQSPFDNLNPQKFNFTKSVPFKKIFFIKKDKKTFLKKLNHAQILSLLVKHNLLSLVGFNGKEAKEIFYQLLLKMILKVEFEELHFTKTRDFMKYL